MKPLTNQSSPITREQRKLGEGSQAVRKNLNFGMRLVLQVSFAVLLIPPISLACQEKALIGPRSVRPHSAGGKFSWGFTSSVAADASVRALDVISTHQALSRGYHEMILPRAIADSTPRMAAYSGLCVAGNALVAHWLAKHGHGRKGELYLAGDIGMDGTLAVHNLALRKLKAGEVVR